MCKAFYFTARLFVYDAFGVWAIVWTINSFGAVIYGSDESAKCEAFYTGYDGTSSMTYRLITSTILKILARNHNKL